jgi:predicted RND superfamily exporter protein
MGRVRVLLWALVLGVAAWSVATRLSVSNPTGQWKPTPTPPADSLWEFARDQFADREIIIAAIRLPEADRRASLRTVAELEVWIGDQPEISTVFGPRGVGRLDLELRLPLQPDEMYRLQRAVLSEDGTLARIFATLRPPDVVGSLALKRLFIERLRERGPAILHPDTELLLAGKPVLDLSLNRLVSLDATRSAPLALAVMLLILLVLLGVSGVPPVLGVLAAVLLLAGVLGLADVPLSTATVVALPITAVVGLSYGLHVTMAVEKEGNVEDGLRRVRRPIVWAYATTVFALLGFALSSIPAIRTFAWSTALGITAALVAALTAVPLLVLRRTSRPPRARRLSRGTFRLYAAAARHPTTVIIAWSIIAVVAVTGVPHVRLEPNNYLGLFPSDHPAVMAHNELDRAFGGSVPLYVLAAADTGSAYDQRRVRDRLVAMMDEATDRVGLGAALLPVDPARRAREPLVEELSAGWFEAKDPRLTRALLSLPVVETPQARAILSDLESLAQRHSDHEVRLQVTGVLHASLPLLAALIDTQVRSLVTLLVVVALVLMVVARSTGGGLRLVAPSVLPLVVVAGAMGYSGLVLDFTTVTVFSIVLGVAVDDTLHIAISARDRPGRGGSPPLAVRRTSDAVTFTSLVAVVGFTVLWLSPFPATQRLGQLLGLGLAVAWLADVTLTPLLLAKRRGQPSST